MNTIVVTIWGTIAALVMFTAIGFILVVQALRPDPAERAARRAAGTARLGLGEAARRYVGPVTPDLALLTPPLRVVLEFVGALCGFPGFGWMMSARVAIGLPLLIVAPTIVYGFYPVYLALSGHLVDSPYVAIRYLPFLAVISASALAAAEVRSSRSGRVAH